MLPVTQDPPLPQKCETRFSRETVPPATEMAPPAIEKGAPHIPNFHLPGNRVFFISLGCPRNLVDTEVMIGLLLQAGYAVATELADADYVIINTCSFLEASRQESLNTIDEILRSARASAKVIVTGCMAQSHGALIRERFPRIHYLLGSGDVLEILKAVQDEHAGEVITSRRSFIEMGEVPRTLSTPKHYAYLKIAEGCRKRCAFCRIPSIKGPLKSKPIEQIVRECEILLKTGVQEIILIAQDLGDWGKDLGHSGSSGLVTLLHAILKIEKDFWLRLLYLYPDEITDALIDCIKSDRRICHYIDMPIQHASDRLLTAMRRTTTKKNIIDTITRLKQEIPDIAIRTSLIVGFPGETEADFEELCQFIQDYPLQNVGIFTYSQEEGTHAATLPDQVPEAIKQRRLERLQKIQKKMVRQQNKKLIGTSLEVIVEGYHPDSKHLMRARSFRECPDIDGEIIITNGAAHVTAFGQKKRVEIIDFADCDLIAHIV